MPRSTLKELVEQKMALEKQQEMFPPLKPLFESVLQQLEDKIKERIMEGETCQIV